MKTTPQGMGPVTTLTTAALLLTHGANHVTCDMSRDLAEKSRIHSVENEPDCSF